MKYIRKYPDLPKKFFDSQGQKIDRLVDAVKAAKKDFNPKTVNELAIAAAASLRQGSGLVYSELQEVIEFACNHIDKEESTYNFVIIDYGKWEQEWATQMLKELENGS